MLLNQAVLALRQSDMARWQHLVPLPVLRQVGVVVTLEEAAARLPPWLHRREVAETVALLAFVRGGPLVDADGNLRDVAVGRSLAWRWSAHAPNGQEVAADRSACLRLVDPAHGGLHPREPVPLSWTSNVARALHEKLHDRSDLWTAARDSVRPRARQGAPATGMDHVLEQAMAATWLPRLQ